MRLLALDTSSDACSAALLTETGIVERHVVEPRQHRELLVPFVEELLGDTQSPLHSLDALILGNGPGSFIGLRIAASVAQGLAFAADIPIVPISSLAAIAAETMSEGVGDRVLVAQDARMEQVYVAEFSADDRGLPMPVAPTVLRDVSEPLSELPGFVAGDAWEKHPSLFAAAERTPGCQRIAVTRPRARWLLELGARGLAHGAAVRPDDLEPHYVREQVATPPSARLILRSGE